MGPRRYHALDSLRAAMMLMGIVVHAGLSYTHMPSSPIWPFKDSHASVLCDAVVMASALFRMPVFFMIAGFFAALIHDRKGTRGLLADRARRILGPFVVAWLVTFPVVRAGFLYADALALGNPAPAAAAVQALQTGGPYAQPGPIHLWFLEYLLIYYVVAVLVVHGARGLGPRATLGFSGRFRTLIRSPWRPIWLAAWTLVPLLASPMGVIPTPLSFVPEPVALVSHGAFFAFGWVLFRNVDQLSAIGRQPWKDLALAALVFPLSLLALRFRALVMPPGWLGPLPPGAGESLGSGSLPSLGLSTSASLGLGLGLLAQAMLAVASSLVIWLLVMGITGLFLRGPDRPVPWLRYLADASYWIYLVHFPLMVWTPILLAPLHAPALVKLALVLVITMVVMLAAYELLVRHTALRAFVARANADKRQDVRPCELAPAA